MAEEKKGLKAALEQFAKAVDDLTSIDVVTVTGKLKMTANGKFDATNIANNFEGAYIVVAATHIDADYDVVNFRTSEPIESFDAFLDLHERSMRVSREGREAIIKIFSDTLMHIIK